MKADLQEMPIAQCKRKFESNSKAADPFVDEQATIIDSQLCTLDNYLGDTGSPLQYKLNDTYYIAGVGIVTYITGENYPQIYARVGSYIDWIENIVWT